jgi:dTDP-4-amino-4,6-dideoxygalactose transaminase
MSVPFIDLKRFENNLIEDFTKKVRELTINTQFIGGKEVEQLEETLKKENDVLYAIGCANGTDAIQLSLRACGIGPGDKVILPDLTFWATFEAIVNVGAEPITVDIDPEDLQMDFFLFQEAIEKFKPKAAILVHLYGWTSQYINEFRKYAKEKQVILIEDGAQSYGVKINQESIYKDSYISTISFYPAKVFGAAGDAGAVLTNQPELANKVRSLGNHGRELHYSHEFVGWNSRLGNLQAAYLNINFPYLKKRIESRRRIAEQYREDLKKYNVHTAPGLVSLKGNLLKESKTGISIEENGYLNVVLIEKNQRDKLIEHLKKNQIGYGIVYPEVISEQKGALPYLKHKVGGENAKKITQSVINLPLFPYLTEKEYETIIKAMNSF